MMNRRRARARFAFAVAAPALISWMASQSDIGAHSAAELSPQERRGKQIYLKGKSESGEIKATLGSGDLEVSAAAFPCANCHGLRGEGSNEGGLQPPPIIWGALTSRRQSALTRQERSPYDETTLARSITSGIHPQGGRLHPGMPHYRMTGEQMADLIAYLKRLGSELDYDVGLSEDTIKVGAALPMTGSLASIGEDVKQALTAYFAEVNEQGGIYGRRFELVVADSRSDPAATVEGTRLLLEKEGVFALVGSLEPGNNQTTNELLNNSEVPLIGPVTLSPVLPPVPMRRVFYLLPSFNDQARSLVDFIAAGRPKDRLSPRLAAIYSSSRFDQDALGGLRSQANAYSMQIAAEQSYDAGRLSATRVVEALAAKQPDAIFFFGSGDDFISVAREMDRLKVDAELLTLAAMVEPAAFGLPAGISSRTYLSYAASLPDKSDFAEFLTVMQKSGVRLRSAGLQAIAFAAAKVLVEAVKISGRQLSHAALVNSLEHLRDFRTGVLPPITFGPNRRIGSTGSYIVGIDVARRQYVPLGKMIVPKGSSQ